MSRGIVTHAIASLYWKASRWTPVQGEFPPAPCVVIGAPHTSNWDFVHMLALAWKNRSPVRWLGKHTLFKGLAGPIMRRLGGISVDRANPGGVVEDLLARIASGEKFYLVISPDASRTNTGHWKSGFYRIARQADLPVALGFIDRDTMTVGLGPTIRLTGDVGADMDVIREFYADKHGARPERRAEPRLLGEHLKP
ncbi:MAG: 1-acyl-sn-glycerol-3-phosphate acyltransferase [Promicromonosporaceae bacterium]|nr:1-acyl-sn-glycerol-3-phosphate acyltransferase [Promicromonosporaceae bacterium]